MLICYDWKLCTFPPWRVWVSKLQEARKKVNALCDFPMSTQWFLMYCSHQSIYCRFIPAGPSPWWGMSLHPYNFCGVRPLWRKCSNGNSTRSWSAWCVEAFLPHFTFCYLLHQCRNENQMISYEQEKGRRPQQTLTSAKANWKEWSVVQQEGKPGRKVAWGDNLVKASLQRLLRCTMHG